MAAHRRQKLPYREKRANPATENKQTDAAPIRAQAPLIEQYYLAVDRQLKSGYGTYEAAEKAAREIKKKLPNRHVTVFGAKGQHHTAIEQAIASNKRRD